MEHNISNQFLTFKVNTEVYALDITCVREVLEFEKVTPIPQTPELIRGVINLRGKVVPVIDMGLKFGMGPTEKTVNACIIIVEVELNEETTLVGALVDSVREVVEIQPEAIEAPPKIGSAPQSSLIQGMGRQNDGFIMILDALQAFGSIGIEQLSIPLPEEQIEDV